MKGVVGDVVFTRVGEAVVVDDADLVTLFHELQRLIDVLHFVVMRMRLAVGSNQTIKAEGSIVGLVAKITTIKEIPLHTPLPWGGVGGRL